MFFRCAVRVAPRLQFYVRTSVLAPALGRFPYDQARMYATASKSHYWANQTPCVYSDDDVKRWVETFPRLRGYESKDIQKWRNAFDTYDHDNDGYISPADFQKNPNMPLKKVQLLKEFDRDNNNLIDFGEFVEAVSTLDILDIRRWFEGFDTVDIQLEFEKFGILDEVHGKRVMGLPQLRRLMNYCDCICVTDKDAAVLLKDMDADNDGVVDFEEFKKVRLSFKM